MVDTGFDKTRLLFFAKFIIFVGIIIYTSHVIQVELIEYYALEDTQPPESILVRPLRRTPWYQVLPKDAIIYSTKDEVIKKRDQLVTEKENFLFINLNAMTLDQYQNGSIIASHDVKAKGEEGSFSETPNGYYKIQWKEENHFSKIHKVWMPWSMHFFGNYFIHGWPYLPDGRPVRSVTSGGCIRLLTEDASALYHSVTVGTSVLVLAAKETPSPEFAYFKRFPLKHEAPRLFDVTSESALIADVDTGEVLAQKNKDKIFQTGPLTKMMAALVVSEAVRDDQKVTVSSFLVKKYPEETQYQAGEVFFTGNLLEPLLLSSSNIAAELVANAMWGFVDTMNEKARSIGLASTQYKDFSGEGDRNTSSAGDLFRLLRFTYAHKRPLFEITQHKNFSLRPQSGGVPQEFENMNWPPYDEKFIGGVSGQLPNGSEELAAVFQVPFSEYGSRHIGIILLESADKLKDVATAISYLQSQYYSLQEALAAQG